MNTYIVRLKKVLNDYSDEETIKASYFTIAKNGMLEFYRKDDDGTVNFSAVYNYDEWIAVREVLEFE